MIMAIGLQADIQTKVFNNCEMNGDLAEKQSFE